MWRAGATSWQEELTDASAWVGAPRFVDDGTHVVAGVFWDPYNIDRLPAPLGPDEPVEDPRRDVVGARVWDVVDR